MTNSKKISVGLNAPQFRENVFHGTPQFPMRIYENDFDNYVNHTIDWHWHPEVEFAVVLSGTVTCTVHDVMYELHQGDGMFINSNTMHMELPTIPDEHPIMCSVCVLPDLFGFAASDLIYTKFVRPIIHDNRLRSIPLTNAISWQHEILQLLRKLYHLSKEQPWGYEFLTRNLLNEIWYRLVINVKDQTSTSYPSQRAMINEKRLKKMLSYIQENYDADLTVDDIAGSANISKSECYRCFQQMIQKKPINYLIEYRLKQAAAMLITTDRQITEICFACGFNHISYFGKIFRQYYGMSPKQFRDAQAELNG